MPLILTTLPITNNALNSRQSVTVVSITSWATAKEYLKPLTCSSYL